MSQLIYKKMSQVMSDLEAIPKDKTNNFHKFKFRGVDQVYSALHPVLAKHGVFFTPEVVDVNIRESTSKDGKLQTGVILKIKYTFYAEDGSNVSCVVCGEALDTSDKATSKAMSIALKYALFQTFCIPTEDEGKNDPDNFSHDKYKNPPQNKPQAPTQDKAFLTAKKEFLGLLLEKLGTAEQCLDYCTSALGRKIAKTTEITVQDLAIIKKYFENGNSQKQDFEMSDMPY